MKILSVKNNTDLCEKVKDYCKNNWAKVYESFAKTADKSVTAERFPQTWVMYERRKGEPQLSIAGFYQLDEQDGLTVHTSLTPFITTLFVDPYFRNTRHFGETALMHAREMLGDMGYDTAYLHTDLVGYYEKYGFCEIGLDITDYGSPTKVYCADTVTDIYYEVYDKHNEKPDHIRLGIYKLKNRLNESRAWHLWFDKHCSCKQWMDIADDITVTAFCDGRVVGSVNFLQSGSDKKNWYLGDLCVAENFRRRGIASKLLRKGMGIIRRKANGGEYLYAYIDRDNKASKGLHKKLGFADTGEIRPFEELMFGDEETTWVKYL